MLREGDRVAEIRTPGDNIIVVTDYEHYGTKVDQMVVVFEFGQISLVPWIIATRDGKQVGRYNVAMLEFIRMKEATADASDSQRVPQ